MSTTKINPHKITEIWLSEKINACKKCDFGICENKSMEKINLAKINIVAVIDLNGSCSFQFEVGHISKN